MLIDQLASLEKHLLKKLQACQLTKSLVVALSGGIDSSVLLHSLVHLKKHGFIGEIQAIHINHGLQSAAADWQQHCLDFCNDLQVELAIIQLKLGEKQTSNVEALAREGRYRFFESKLNVDQCLLMAHHQDDQAETLLFRLLRGCGIAGASAIPEQRKLGKGMLFRPFLEVQRSLIEDYAKQNKVNWVDDPSNQCHDFSRNYLRHQVLPLIRQKWPSYTKTFSRFCHLAHEQKCLLEDIAQEDLNKVSEKMGVITLSSLRLLSNSRCKNLFHYWGKTFGLLNPSNNEINELLKQIKSKNNGSIKLNFAGLYARCFSNQLMLIHRNQPKADFSICYWADMLKPITLSNGVIIQAKKNSEAVGLRLPAMNEKVKITPRAGGEKCWPVYRNKPTQLKKIYQELQIPPWQREWLPIVYYNEQLVAVPGVFICKNFINTSPGESFILSIKH